MNIAQTFFKDYFDAKSRLHHHSIVSGVAAISAFVVISSSLFGLGYRGTYAADGADMSISNNASSQYVDAGDTVVFLYFYQNEDYPSKSATNITVGSSIPAGMTYISATPTPDVVDSSLQWNNLSDDYGIITVEMQVDSVDNLAGSTVRVSADGEDPYSNNNSATADITSRTSTSTSDTTDISISTTSSASSISVGQSIEYTLSYENISNTTSEEAIIINTLPEGVTYIASDREPSDIDGNNIAWNLGDVAPGDASTITVWGSVSTLLDDGFNILNFTSVDSNNADDDTSNNISVVSSEVVNNGTDLYVTTTAGSSNVDTNKDFDLDILLGNRGPNTASNITTSLTLPVGTTIVSSSPNYTSVAGRTYAWTLDSLSLGGMSTISLTLRSSVAGIHDLVAVIESDTTEINSDDNGSLFALTVGSVNSSAGAAAGGGGGAEGGDTSQSLGDILQAVKSEITNEHSVADTTAVAVSTDNVVDAWTVFQPNTQAVQSIAAKVDTNVYTPEMIEAFVFAKNVGMTSFSDITKAMMYDELSRAQLAKFAVEYATDVLGVEADMNRSDMCFGYTDTSKAGDLLQYIQYACMMKLLGQKADGNTPAEMFRPNDLVTRAEFGTFMSRLVFGNMYNSKNANDPKWYQAHLEALKANGIITQIDQPFKEELRAWAMVIMYRTAEFLANK